MWATVRAITKNTKLKRHVVSSVVMHSDSRRLDNLEYEYTLMSKIREWMSCIVRDEEVQNAAVRIAHKWFEYVILCIMQRSTSSPTLDVKDGRKSSVIRRTDIVWSINNLASNTGLRALGYICQNQKFDMKLAISYPYLLALMDRFMNKKFRGYSGSSMDNEKKLLKSCALSSSGALALYSWIRKILTLTVKHAASIRSDNKKEISSQDIIRAFNWVRQKKLYQSYTVALTLNSEDKPNQNYSTQDVGKEMNIRKNKEIKDNSVLSNLPDDIIASHVLPKLSWDSIFRFKCVSKSWRKTIESFHFQRLLHEQDDSQIQSFGFLSRNGDVWMQVNEKRDDLELFGLSTTFNNQSYVGSIFHSSCNGFVCLYLPRSSGSGSEFVIGNPLTGEWTLISTPTLPSARILPTGPGLAMNLSSSPPWYKLVITVFVNKTQKYLFYVFSSEDRKWKIFKAAHTKFFRRGNSVYINGLMYWVCNGNKLNWFDPQKDESNHSVLPCPYENPSSYLIGSYEPPGGGQTRLSCTVKIGSQKVETYTYLGKNKWVKLLSILISTLPNAQPFPYMGGAHQFCASRNKVVACNISTGEINTVLVRKKNNFDNYMFPFAFRMNICSLPKMSK